jgi:hypothetical protein
MEQLTQIAGSCELRLERLEEAHAGPPAPTDAPSTTSTATPPPPRDSPLRGTSPDHTPTDLPPLPSTAHHGQNGINANPPSSNPDLPNSSITNGYDWNQPQLQAQLVDVAAPTDPRVYALLMRARSLMGRVQDLDRRTEALSRKVVGMEQ